MTETAKMKMEDEDLPCSHPCLSLSCLTLISSPAYLRQNIIAAAVFTSVFAEIPDNVVHKCQA
eukprot:m.256174 g.256174  ORF g.256174 m.256174 type:complete len:63 (-) comp21088_c0_seq1:1161-1349(-)